MLAPRKEIHQLLILERPPTHSFKRGEEETGGIHLGEGQSHSSPEKKSPKVELGSKHFLLMLKWTCIIKFLIGWAAEEEAGQRAFQKFLLISRKSFCKME